MVLKLSLEISQESLFIRKILSLNFTVHVKNIYLYLSIDAWKFQNFTAKKPFNITASLFKFLTELVVYIIWDKKSINNKIKAEKDLGLKT